MATKKRTSEKRSSKGASSGGKVEKVMHEFKRGELRSGGGAKVKSRKQAIAIGLSEAREAGENVGPAKPSRGSKKKTAKKAPTRRTSEASAPRSKKTSKKSSSRRSASR